MNTKCAAITRNGKPCSASAVGGQWCTMHDPEQSERRVRNARKGGKRGGRGRPSVSPELDDIRTQLKAMTWAVLTGKYTTGQCSVACMILNTRLRLVEVERKLRESDELEARLEALELQQESPAPRQGRYAAYQ